MASDLRPIQKLNKYLGLPSEPPTPRPAPGISKHRRDKYMQICYPLSTRPSPMAILYMYWMWDINTFSQYCPWLVTGKKLCIGTTWLLVQKDFLDIFFKAKKSRYRRVTHKRLWYHALPRSPYRQLFPTVHHAQQADTARATASAGTTSADVQSPLDRDMQSPSTAHDQHNGTRQVCGPRLSPDISSPTRPPLASPPLSPDTVSRDLERKRKSQSIDDVDTLCDKHLKKRKRQPSTPGALSDQTGDPVAVQKGRKVYIDLTQDDKPINTNVNRSGSKLNSTKSKPVNSNLQLSKIFVIANQPASLLPPPPPSKRRQPIQAGCHDTASADYLTSPQGNDVQISEEAQRSTPSRSMPVVHDKRLPGKGTWAGGRSGHRGQTEPPRHSVRPSPATSFTRKRHNQLFAASSPMTPTEGCGLAKNSPDTERHDVHSTRIIRTETSSQHGGLVTNVRPKCLTGSNTEPLGTRSRARGPVAMEGPLQETSPSKATSDAVPSMGSPRQASISTANHVASTPSVTSARSATSIDSGKQPRPIPAPNQFALRPELMDPESWGRKKVFQKRRQSVVVKQEEFEDGM
ncbi:hypothetical protein BDZ85DRAFT_138851 [Elsinoe ampelina]|uniref:Uncharacterized protein n=1 Tax=Elsinoe ampelina TaxID=302913 RepID=A0A6A6G9F5_9PEZI|nr:hypothetical protein BDZ85DRAFT_138851 [Elsinoe ampelina]